MYDLAKKEVFFVVTAIRGEKKIRLKHWFRQPTLQDWVFYHKARGYIGLSTGKNTFEFSNVMQEEDEAFWKTLIVRVEGYHFKGKDLMELEDWKDRVPLSHKLNAVGGFLIFYRKDVVGEDELVTEEFLDLGEESEIELQFIVYQDSCEETLKFFFSAPDAKDFIKFNRLMTKMRLRRTKQRNVSAIEVPSDIYPFVKLFDKMILRVEGYSYGAAKDLMKVEKWKDYINAYHKKETLRELFTSSLEEEEKTERG